MDFLPLLLAFKSSFFFLLSSLFFLRFKPIPSGDLRRVPQATTCFKGGGDISGPRGYQYHQITSC